MERPRTAMGNAYQVGFPVLLRSLRHSLVIKPVNKVRISADLQVPVSNQFLILHWANFQICLQIIGYVLSIVYQTIFFCHIFTFKYLINKYTRLTITMLSS